MSDMTNTVTISLERVWAKSFECKRHGNMGATDELAAAVTTKNTCLLCERTHGQHAAMLKRIPR